MGLELAEHALRIGHFFLFRSPFGSFWSLYCPPLGARLRGRTATQRSKKGSEKALGRVLGRVLGKSSLKGSENGEGSQKRF